MIPFFVTFGQKWRHEVHPGFPAADPDGWLTIVAPGYRAAREFAFALLGTAWCDLYCPETGPPPASVFPLGELARVQAGDLEAAVAVLRGGAGDGE